MHSSLVTEEIGDISLYYASKSRKGLLRRDAVNIINTVNYRYN